MLDRFLNPRRIALIGASEGTAKIGGRILHTLLQGGWQGAIHPVNLKGGILHGLPACRSIAEVPEPVDLALIAVPAPAVAAALEDCAAAGVQGAVVFSSGFAEAGEEGARLQRELAEVARRTGIRVAGPNAEGFASIHADLAATFSPAVHVEKGPDRPGRNIAIASQSGGLGFAFYQRGRGQDLSFSHIVSVGNQADLTIADFARHFAEDESVGVVMLYLEGIRDPAGFLEMARAAAGQGKPIVVAKAGRSEAGRQAAASHTGALAGSTAACDAVFRRHGILRAEDQDELLDIAAGLSRHPLPKGRRVCLITTSGGVAVWMTDACARFGLEVPELPAEYQARVRREIPHYGAARNPVDITAQGMSGLLGCLEILYDAPNIDAFIIAGSFAHEARLLREGRGLAEIARRGGKPVLFHSYSVISEASKRIFAELDLHCFATMTGAVRALRTMADHAEFLAHGRPRLLEAPPVQPLPEAARCLLQGSGALTEHESKALLAACGLALPPERLATSEAEAVAAAEAIGFPVALKIQSRDIPHKTEAGGVVLDLRDAGAVRAAHARILDSARAHAPGAAIQGVAVQAMAPKGVECIIGLVRDADFGPMVLCGLGGIHAEVLRDTVMAPCPVGIKEAREMILSLRGARLLAGARGAPPADVDALAALLARVSEIGAAAGPRLRELDLNPVIVHPEGQGVSIADALAVLEEMP